MKKQALSILLALILCIGLTVPALAGVTDPVSSQTPDGKNNLVIRKNIAEVWIVNENNELWQYIYPSQGQAAKSEKFADNVKEIVDTWVVGTASGPALAILKTDGSLWKLRDLGNKYELGVWIESGISTISRSSVYEFFALHSNGELWCYTTDSEIKIDSGVTDCISYYYLKADSSLWSAAIDAKAGTASTKQWLENVSTVWKCDEAYIAQKTDGSLWGWGDEPYGQLGVQPDEFYYMSYGGGSPFILGAVVKTPTLILNKGVERVIMTPFDGTFAIMEDGRILSWGGVSYNTRDDAHHHQNRTDLRWMIDAEYTIYHKEYTDSRWTRIIQYSDRLEIHGEANGQEAAYTFTINTRLLGVGGSGSTPSQPAHQAPSSWAVNAADWIKGYPEIYEWFYDYWQYEICREEFAAVTVTLVEEALGKTLVPASASTFTDTSDTYVLKAFRAGIATGTSATTFSPDDNLTREQLATMLYRAIRYIEQESGKTILTQTGSLNRFSDKGQVSSWAVEGITALASNGIMSGTSETTLSPKSTATIEQALVLALRVLDNLK